MSFRWLSEHFELRRAGEAGNVRAMEGLRGFAAFLVFLAHYSTLVRPWIDKQSALWVFGRALTTIGQTGVDLFFVLSGYLIYGSLISKEQPFMKYMKRRIMRIYPTFIPVFLLYIVLSFFFPDQSRIPAASADAAAYLVQNFLLLPGVFPMRPMITVAWSLSYEMFYYLACPLVIAVFRLRQRSVAWRIVFTMVIVAAATLFLAASRGPIRLIMFCSGILLYETINTLKIPAPRSAGALGALVFGLLTSLIPLPGGVGDAIGSGILFVTFFAVCFCCFCRPQDWLSRAFSWTPLRWLGNMSYSYYLLHGLALKFFFLLLAVFLPAASHGPLFFATLMVAMFALTLLPTAALFLVVERPFSLAPVRGDAHLQPIPQCAAVPSTVDVPV